MNRFAGYVARLRDMRGMSAVEFAARLKITPQYLCDIEKGRRLPSVRVVNAVVKFLGGTLDHKERLHNMAARAHGWEV